MQTHPRATVLNIALRAILGAIPGMAFSILMLSFIVGIRGQDAHVYCRVAAAAAHGGNPYFTNEIGTSLSWDYQPVYLVLVGLLCAPPVNLEVNYMMWYFVVIIVSTYLWSGREELGLAIFMSFSIFAGFSWVLYSGNFAILEFFLFSCAFAFLKGRKWAASAALFGLGATLKLIPLVYLALFAFIPTGKLSRLRVIIIGLVMFALPLVLSEVIYPRLTPYFFMQIVGAIPNQHNAIGEAGGLYNPSLSSLAALFLKLDPLKSSMLISFGLEIAGFYFLINLHRKLDPQKKYDFYQFFGYAFIVLSLLLPRNKPYGFVLLAPAIFWLLSNEKGRIRQIVLFLAIGLPALFLVIDTILRFDYGMGNTWFILIPDYGQLLALFLVAAVFYVSSYAGKRPEDMQPGS